MKIDCSEPSAYCTQKKKVLNILEVEFTIMSH